MAPVKAEDWNRKHAGFDLLFGGEPNRFLVSELADDRPGRPEPGRALDLACGSGRNAVWLARQGWRVTAVDFSDVAVERARRLAAEARVEVDWACRDLLSYEPAAAAFDLVAVFYLQLPPDERRRVLASAAGAVAPGGLLLFVAHDLVNLTEGVGGPRDAGVLTTPGAVAAELPGLSIEKAERVERPVDADGGPRVAIDTLVRARRC